MNSEIKVNSSILRFDSCELDLATRQLWRAGELVHLPRLPFEVLLHLIESRSALVKRDELLSRFWHDRPGGDEALTRCMSSIRKALGDMEEPVRMIETRRAEGYRFVAAVVAVQNVGESASTPPSAIPLAVTSDLALPVRPRFAQIAATIAALGVCGLTLGVTWNGAAEPASSIPDRKVKILWVDDHPERNTLEITTLTRAGAIVDTARSNAEAASHVVGRQYDLVISDIRRDQPQEYSAGLDLPRELTPDRNRLPPMVYYVGTLTHSSTPDGYPITARRSELFRLITDALKWETGKTLVIEVESKTST